MEYTSLLFFCVKSASELKVAFPRLDLLYVKREDRFKTFYQIPKSNSILRYSQHWNSLMLWILEIALQVSLFFFWLSAGIQVYFCRICRLIIVIPRARSNLICWGINSLNLRGKLYSIIGVTLHPIELTMFDQKSIYFLLFKALLYNAQLCILAKNYVL